MTPQPMLFLRTFSPTEVGTALLAAVHRNMRAWPTFSPDVVAPTPAKPRLVLNLQAYLKSKRPP